MIPVWFPFSSTVSKSNNHVICSDDNLYGDPERSNFRKHPEIEKKAAKAHKTQWKK